MGHFYFVRHAESEANRDDWLAGHRDSPLTEAGRAQAAEARPRILAQTVQGVLVSDLRRASETARILIGDQALTLRTTPALRERAGGDWEGRPLAELRELGAIRSIRGWDVRPPGGESLNDVALRALHVLAEDDSGEDLLVVTHGALIRAVVHVFEHGPGGELSSWRPDNVEVVPLFASPGRWAELALACQEHASRIDGPAEHGSVRHLA